MANTIALKIRIDSNGGLVLEDLKGKIGDLGKVSLKTGDVLKQVFASKIMLDAIEKFGQGVSVATNEVMKFQDTMAKLKVIGGVTTAGMKDLNAEIIKISNNSEFSASKLAEASLELAKGGVKGAEAMKVLSVVSDLATSSQGDLTEVMMTTINSMKAFNNFAFSLNILSEFYMTRIVIRGNLGKAWTKSLPIMDHKEGG
jgi:hypothetical protein